MPPGLRVLAIAVFAALTASCATLEQLRAFVAPPRFEEARDRRAEIRLLGPGTGRPLGGATIRLWTTVTNPNSFGFALSELRGSLFLQDGRAADIDLPLGLPLAARATETFPIDVTISFAEIPGIADAIRRAANRQPIDYRLDGTVGIDAGQFGRPTFGPMTIIRGDIGGPASGTIGGHQGGG